MTTATITETDHAAAIASLTARSEREERARKKSNEEYRSNLKKAAEFSKGRRAGF